VFFESIPSARSKVHTANSRGSGCSPRPCSAKLPVFCRHEILAPKHDQPLTPKEIWLLADFVLVSGE
jgi:hypothetical protein